MRLAVLVYVLALGLACAANSPPDNLTDPPDAGSSGDGGVLPDAGTPADDDPLPGSCADIDRGGHCDQDDGCAAISDDCLQQREPVCLGDGVCSISAEPLHAHHVAFAVAIDRELYLLGSNSLSHHWDGQRWSAFTQPLVVDWLWYGATPGALWGISKPDTGIDAHLPSVLWRRDRQAGHWEGFDLPFRATQLFAADDSNVWLAGGEHLVRFDGHSMGTEISLGADITQLTGSSADNVWAVAGAIWHFDGTRWSSWIEQPCDGDWIESVVPESDGPRVHCASGSGARLLRWDQDRWTTMVDPLPEGARLESADLGVWQRTRSTIQRTDGSHRHRAVAGWSRQLFRAPGASLWHTTSAGVAAEWDGSKWIDRGSTTPRIRASTLSPEGEVWLAGENGFLARRQAKGWQRIDTGLEEDLNSVAAHGRHVWVTAQSLAARMRSDGSWSSVAVTGRPQVWMSRCSPGVGWLAGFDGSLREDLTTGLYTLQLPLPGTNHLAGQQETNLWAATRDGLFQWTPSTPSSMQGRWVERLTRWHGVDQVSVRGEHVWAVAEGELLHHSGTGGFVELPFADEGAGQVQAIEQGQAALVRGRFGSVYRHEGSRFELVRASGCLRLVESACGVECLTESGVESAEALDWQQVALASAGGQLLRKRGDSWEPLGPSGRAAWTDGLEGVLVRERELWRYADGRWERKAEVPGGHFPAVWARSGEVFLAGGFAGDHVVLRVEGERIEEIWRGPASPLALTGSAGELYLGGTGGLLLRWNGQVWQEAAPGILEPGDTVHSLSPGAASGELWAAVSTRPGELLHLSGGRWERLDVPGAGRLTAVFAAGDRLWVAGDDGLWERTGSDWRQRLRDRPPGLTARMGGDPSGRDGIFLGGGYGEGLWQAPPSN